MNKQKIALITNVLSTYRIPCFTELRRLLGDQLQIFTLAQDMVHRRYVLSEHSVHLPLTSLKGLKWHRPPLDDRHLNDILPIIKFNPNILVLSGWDEPTYLILWLYGLLLRKKIFFWVESTLYDSPRGGLKDKIKTFLLHYAEGCIVPGQRAKEYCLALGMASDRIFIAPNATDRLKFSQQAEKLLPLRDALRANYGIVDDIVILYVGRLVESYKNVTVLIHAFSKLSQTHANVRLIIVGDGENRDDYEVLAQYLNLTKIDFTGLLNHDILCEYYAIADLMVLVSKSETWGFVLNEGMEFALPLVVSKAVGAVPDLLYPNENGLAFETENIDELTQCLSQLVENGVLREQMRSRSQEIITHFSPENWAQGVIEALRSSSDQAK